VSDGDGSLEQLGALVDVLGNVALEVRRPTMTVKPGDRILMGKFTGSDIQIRSKKDDIPEELTILREDEVLAVLEAEEGDELDETVENPQAVAAAAGREVVDAEAPNEEDLDEQDLAALEDALGLPQEVVGPPPDEPEPEEETPARPKIEDGE
jgi:co-chaperonin GroES (HSP10)